MKSIHVNSNQDMIDVFDNNIFVRVSDKSSTTLFNVSKYSEAQDAVYLSSKA